MSDRGCPPDMAPAPDAPAGGELPGRARLEDRLEHALAHSASQGTRCALLLLDLGAAGASAAEQAALLRAHLPEVARLAGNVAAEACDAASSLTRLADGQIALLLDPSPHAGMVAKFADRVFEEIRSHLNPDVLALTCHIGIAMGPTDGGSAQELLLAARGALARARLRNAAFGVAFFAEAQDRRVIYLRELTLQLAQALPLQQLHLVYQPIVQLADARIAGFEALLRWTHPLRGVVTPSEFIPVAEDTGLIVAIGDWVLDQALAQLARLDRQGLPPVRMFVNVAAGQLAQPGFVNRVGELLAHHHIKPARLELEITERMVTNHDAETLAILQALRRIGVTLAVDDFGTGYSNLNNLTRLPIDTLKVDMSFTQAATHSASSASVCRLICDLGRALDLKVVVEGIETAGQHQYFQSLPCGFGQGYLFSKPLAADAAAELLGARRALVEKIACAPRQHLLLLDDEENVLAALRRLLRREGYQVHATQSTEEAFEILARHPVGVVVSDQRMAGGTGTEFLHQVKKLHPDAVRIVLSGYSEIKAVTDAVNEGAVWRYLSKPWDDDDLREQIRLAFVAHRLAREHADKHASVLRQSSRLEAVVSHQNQRMAIESDALAAARDSLAGLPIPVLGVDDGQMVVMSNAEADRCFGAGMALLGETLGSLFEPEVEQAVSDARPLWLEHGGQRYRLHAQPLDSTASNGRLLCFIPEIKP